MEVELQGFDREPDIALQVEDQERVRMFNLPDLSSLSQNRFSTGDFEVAEIGSIRVEIQLSDQEGSIADGQVELEALENVRWFVGIALISHVLTDSTCGPFCLGVEAFPVAERFRSAPAESLRVFWSAIPIRPEAGL